MSNPAGKKTSFSLDGRRDFFNEAAREVLAPFANIIERRITPILSVLEQIPEQAERLANTNFKVLDQPLSSPPLQQKRAVIDSRLCLRHHESCTLCLDACPSKSLFIGPETGQMRVRKNTCIGCGQCVSQCPTMPQAITLVAYTPPIDPIIA